MKTKQFSRQDFQNAADYIAQRTRHRPEIGMVLGSGFGEFADAIEDADFISYADIPHFPRSTVEGHKGRLVVGRMEGQTIMVMQGRVHFYEGFTMEEVTYHGEFVHLDQVKLDVAFGDTSPRDIPIYIGATGPKMLQLAGEICDGVVLNYVVSVDYIRNAVEAAHAAHLAKPGWAMRHGHNRAQILYFIIMTLPSYKFLW